MNLQEIEQVGWQEFEPLIKSLVAKSGANNGRNFEDLCQILRVKVWELLPNLHLPRNQLFKLVKVACKNKLTDQSRRSIRRPDTSNYALEVDMEKYGSSDLSARLVSPTYSARYNELESDIIRWAKSHTDEDYSKYITECLFPSDNTEIAWEMLQHASKNYRRLREIPPLTLIRIIGMSQAKMYKIRKELLSYITKQGYMDEDTVELGDCSRLTR